MCLLFLLFGEIQTGACANLAKSLCTRQLPLLIVSVRDENFHRETARGSVNDTGRYSPKDMEAGGTWFSYNHTTQRYAIILNHDNPPCDSGSKKPEELLSRGALPTMFTDSNIPITSFLKDIKQKFGFFNGFNLIFGDLEGCYYVSNRNLDSPVQLEPNVLHGFSNGDLHADPAAWPRLPVGKSVIELEVPSLGGGVASKVIETESLCKQHMRQLVEAFKSNEYVNPDVSMHTTCHESLILPPTSCDENDVLYGTRTLTALVTFATGREGEGEESADGRQGGVRCGVFIVESDLDPGTQRWSDKEHVLL